MCLQDLQPSIAGPAEVSLPADAADNAEEEAAAPAAVASGQTLEELTAAAASAQVLSPPCVLSKSGGQIYGIPKVFALRQASSVIDADWLCMNSLHPALQPCIHLMPRVQVLGASGDFIEQLLGYPQAAASPLGQTRHMKSVTYCGCVVGIRRQLLPLNALLAATLRLNRPAVQERLASAKSALEAVRGGLSSCAGAAVQGMKTLMLAPKATYLACQAALLILGLPSNAISPWQRCRSAPLVILCPWQGCLALQIVHVITADDACLPPLLVALFAEAPQRCNLPAALL